MAWVRGTDKEEQKEKQDQVATVSPYVQQRREKKNQLQKAFDSYEQANVENLDKYRREMQAVARKNKAEQEQQKRDALKNVPASDKIGGKTSEIDALEGIVNSRQFRNQYRYTPEEQQWVYTDQVGPPTAELDTKIKMHELRDNVNKYKEYQEAVARGKEKSKLSVGRDGEHGGGGSDTKHHRLYKYLTPEETDYYAYLLDQEGEESADKWLNSVMSELSRREFEPLVHNADKTWAHSAWETIGSFGNNLLGGLIGLFDDTYELVTTGKFDPYSAGNKFYNMGQAQRAKVQDTIPSDIGKFAYNIGCSIGDSLLSIALGQAAGTAVGAAGTATGSLVGGSRLLADYTIGAEYWSKIVANGASLGVMAAEAAEDTMKDSLARGLSYNQSFALGVLGGAFEVLTERYSLDALFSDEKGIAYFLKNVLTEGSEEGASNLLNYVADRIVAGDMSELKTAIEKHIKEGDSYGLAFVKALQDHLPSLNLDVLGGMISGGVMAGPSSVSSGFNYLGDKISLAVLKNYGIDIKAWVQFYKEAKAIETTAAESPATEDVTGEEETGETAEPAPSEGKKYVVVPVVNGQMTMDTEEYSTPQEAFAAIASKSGDGIEYAVIDMDTQEEVFPEGYDATQEKPTLDVPEAPEELKAETETVPSDTAETVATEEVTPQRKMGYATQEDTDAVMAEMTGGQGTTEDTDTVAEEAFKGEKDITPKEGWVAQNKNETMDEKTPRLNTLLARIQKAFDVNVSKGKVKRGALGTFSVRDEQVRIREANDVPTAMHEVGHYLDKKYGISKNKEVSKMLADAISRIRPGWSSQYKPKQLAGEAVAEFVRYYVTDKTNALSPEMFGKLGQSIIGSLGKQDLKMLNEIADAFNRYANSSIRERLDAAFGSASELQKELDALETVKDKAKRAGKGVMRIVDKNNDLKSVTSIPEEKPKKITSAEDVNNILFRNPAKKAANTYQRAMYTVHAAQIAARIVKGKWMVNSDGRIVTMKDVDGNEILDENGKPMQEKSLEGILAPLTDGVKSREQRIKIVKDFNALVIAERALAIQKYDTLKAIETGEDVALRRVAEPAIDNPEAMKQIRDEILAEHPKWQAIADDYSRWQRNLLRTWGLETGLITPELFAELGKYDFYAPLQRFHGSFGGHEMKAKESSKIVQRLRGSNEPIINPTDSTAANVQQMVSAALKNNVRKAAAQFANIEEGSANLLSRVPPDRERTFIDAETAIQNVQKQAEKAGVDPEEIDKLTAQLNEIITGIEKWGVKNQQADNIMVVLQNGKKKYYEIHSDALKNALVTMTEPQMSSLVKAAKYLSNKFKTLTTGVNFIWALKNKVMDIQTAWYSSIEKNWLKFMAGEAKWTWDAIKGTFGKSDEYELYQQRGGGSSEYLGHQTKATEAIMREVFNTNKDGFVGFVRNIVETAGKMSEVIEQSTRYAEYQRYLQKGGKPMDAILAADEVTVNFNRGSKVLSEIDAFIPYSKSAFNGLYHDINLFTDPKNRKANIFRLAISNAVGASIEMLVGCLVAGGWDEWEKEYDKLSAWQRNNYYCFYVGKWFPGGFVKIPKSHLLSVPASLITTAATQVFGEGNERDRADEMRKFGTYLLDQISPFNLDNPFGSMIGVSTGLGLAGNQTFSGGKIVPDSYKGPKREQYNDNTSWLAYELGQLFGWSPMKIDYVLSQNFGILADISSTVKVNGLSGKSVESLFRNTWYADNAYSTDRVNRLYDDKEDADTQAKSIYATDEDKYRADAFDAVTTVVGQMIKASRGTETERDAKLKAGDIADEFRSGIGKATLELAGDISDSFVEGDRTRDKNIVSLASRTGTNIKDLAPYDPLYSTFSIGKGDSKRTYTVDGLTLGSMWMDYVSGINDAYDGIFATEGISDEDAVTALKKAKNLVKEAVKAKYALVSEGIIKEDVPIETNEFGLTTSTYAYIMAVGKRVKEDADKDKKKTEVAAFVDSLDVSNESKYMLMEAFGYTSPKGTNSESGQYDWVSDWWDYYYEQKRNKGDE